MAQIPLSWPDAVAFCRQQGGSLPRINNSDSWAWANKSQITLVDGFGAGGLPWPVGLPGGSFWAGTQISDHSGFSWVVGDGGGKVNIGGTNQGEAHRVVCVASNAPNPAPVSQSVPASNLPTATPTQTTQNNSISVTQAAEQGDAEAQYSLGQMFLTGNGAAQDAGQAAYWLRKAAEQGVVIAQYKLGEMYMAGNGVPQSIEQATYWFRKAAPAQTAQKAPEPTTSAHKTAETGKGKIIAVGSAPMTWSAAKTFCQQRGGRLPTGNEFGAGDAWPSGLPITTVYWTNRENSFSGPNYSLAFGINEYNEEYSFVEVPKSDKFSVVCVP